MVVLAVARVVEHPEVIQGDTGFLQHSNKKSDVKKFKKEKKQTFPTKNTEALVQNVDRIVIVPVKRTEDATSD